MVDEHSTRRGPKAKDRAGLQYGRWTALERAGSNRHRGALWLCRCECGGEGVVPGTSLNSGASKSCGCLKRESAAAAGRANGKLTKHGHAGHHRRFDQSPTYRSWVAMKERCTKPTHHNWPRYGGRGITVCDRWRNSFENFLADMGERPEGKTLDRKDNDLGYFKANCQWATAKEQANNRRKRGTTAE